MILDTHKAVETLMASGCSKKNAESIVKIVNEGQGHWITKKDLELEISKLKNDIFRWILGLFISILAVNLTTVSLLVKFFL